MSKILWVSNAVYVPSGYGVQSRLFCLRAVADGHEVINFAFYGHGGPAATWNNILVLPRSKHGYGEDMLIPHYEHHKPDHMVMLMDIWPYAPEVLDKLPLTAWVPIDHDPAPPQVIDRLKHVKHIWSMSRFGEAKLKEAGLTSTYVPHGVDTNVFKPVDGLRASARERMGIDEADFLAVMVAANKGWPSRKNIPEVLAAWATFIKQHPTARLYLHTDVGQDYGGLDVVACASFYGIPAHNLIFPNAYQLENGMHGDGAMNALYNAADVKLLPSAGEGFGIPVIEAQASGCPVIVTDATAQAELAGPGYKITVDPDDWIYTLQRSHQARVRPSRIVEALEWALEQRGNADLRTKAREFAMQYDADHVWTAYMKPALEAQKAAKDQLEAERASRTAARLEARSQAATKAEEVTREPQTLSAS